jgi:hypothetical protein
MPSFQRNHIVIHNRTEVLPYTSNRTGRTKVVARSDLDRNEQGELVREQFNNAVNNFRPDIDNEFVYLVFKSPLNFLLDLDKLNNTNYRLASYKTIYTENPEGKYYEATVYRYQHYCFIPGNDGNAWLVFTEKSPAE